MGRPLAGLTRPGAHLQLMEFNAVVVCPSRIVDAVLRRDLLLTAQQVLDECFQRGLVVRSERTLAGRAGSRHWHLRRPGLPGTLELNEWQGQVWVTVHPRRDGGWATALADELAEQRGRLR